MNVKQAIRRAGDSINATSAQSEQRIRERVNACAARIVSNVAAESSAILRGDNSQGINFGQRGALRRAIGRRIVPTVKRELKALAANVADSTNTMLVGLHMEHQKELARCLSMLPGIVARDTGLTDDEVHGIETRELGKQTLAGYLNSAAGEILGNISERLLSLSSRMVSPMGFMAESQGAVVHEMRKLEHAAVVAFHAFLAEGMRDNATTIVNAVVLETRRGL